MTHVTRRLTAKNRDQLRNPTLGNRVWATFFTILAHNARCKGTSIDDTARATDVIASSCAGWLPRCVVSVASCPRLQRAPKLDEFIMQRVAVVVRIHTYNAPNDLAGDACMHQGTRSQISHELFCGAIFQLHKG